MLTEQELIDYLASLPTYQSVEAARRVFSAVQELRAERDTLSAQLEFHPEVTAKTTVAG